MNKEIILNLPPYINIIIIKQKKKIYTIYLYNITYYIQFNISSHNFYKYDIETNSMIFKKLIPEEKLIYNTNYIYNFLKSLNVYFFFKIKFKGKGYRIRFYKNNKIVKFYFGKSHITMFFFKKINLKKITKYKFILKGINLNILKVAAIKVNNIKPLNVYTLRGLRMSRQKIFKRKGKKGTYI